MKQRLLALAAATCIAIPSLPLGLVDECKVSAADLSGYDIVGCSVVLNEGVRLNYFVTKGTTESEEESAEMVFTIGSGETQTVALKGLPTQEVPVTTTTETETITENKDCYVVPCQLVARQMSDTVSAKVVLNGSEGEASSYSVKEYASVILAEDSTYSPASKRMVRAMLDYGASSQIHLNYNTDSPANGGSNLTKVPEEKLGSEFDCTTEGTIPAGLKYFGMSLLLKTNLNIRHYFQVASGKNITDYNFKHGAQQLTAVKSGSLYYVEIPNVTAKNLGEFYPVSVNNGQFTVSACALTYCYQSYDSADATLKPLICALYGYYQSACDYDTYISFKKTDYSGLVINEVCSSNASGLQDASKSFPDWVEIYNGSDEDLPIEGIGFSNGNKKKFKFMFEEGKTLASGQYVIIFCDEDVDDNLKNNEYHASFKISASGENLFLTHPDYGELDAVTVPETVPTDYTYSRLPNGQSTFEVCQPTPNAANEKGEVAIVVPEPVFDKASGFYSSEGFSNVNVTKPDDAPSGTKIYYTTDGSDPTENNKAGSSEGSLSLPIVELSNNAPSTLSSRTDYSIGDNFAPNQADVPKAVVVKAVCYKDGVYSDIVTQTYFVNKPDIQSLSNNMHVISLVSDPKNFIDKNTGIFVKGQMYEDYEQDTSSDRPTYEKWDPENPTNYNQSGRDWEREVTMQVFKDGALKYSTNVGLRVSGNATRSYRQKSLNLYARKEYGDKKIKYPFFSGLIDVNGKAIDSFDKLTLRNGGNDFEDARIRDDIVHEAVGKQSNPDDNLNVGTLAKADTIVFIDGEFWGYYSLQEKLDEEYVDSHYDIKADDVTVYKCGDDYEGNEIIEAYNTFAIEAAEADMTVEANYTKFCNTVDINSFIDYVAVQAYIGNYDWANEVGTNNWFLWRSNEVDAENPYADTKWRFALYDTEFAMARYNDGKDNVDSNFFNIIKKCEVPGNLGAIFLKLMEREDFKKQFTDRFDQIAKTNFNATSIKDAIDARTGRLATAIGWTNRRFGINSMNQDNMNRLKDFFTNRYDKIKKYLDGIHGVEERPLLDTPIELYTSTGQTFDEYTNDFCELSKATNGFTMEVITPGEERHSIQVVVAHDLQLEFGAQYKFSYKMVYEGTNGGNQPGMSGNVMQGGGNYTVFGTHEHTSNEGTDITEIFDMSQDDLGIRISFDFWEKGKYTITDIKLEQIR